MSWTTVLATSAILSAAQAPTAITGEAALKHPAGQAAVRSAELITAGKMDEAMALRTKDALSDWKSSSADERKATGDSIRKMTPDPKMFADAVRKSGLLNVMGNTAVMNAETSKGKAVAYFGREDGVWKISSGPMVFAIAEPANETRIENADVLKHPIGPLALQYVELVHGGRIDEAKRLAAAEVQAKWNSESAQERTESLDYLRKTLPTKAELSAGLQSGGRVTVVLLIEDDTIATLNIIRSEQRTTGPNTTTYSSSTTTIGFVMERGQWKLNQ
jgi:hypothetical protein